MRIDYMEYFNAIVKNGSITNAAKELFISQQALSFALNTMESEIGTPLLERLPRGVKLTKSGEIFYRTTSRIVEEYNQALAAINTSKEIDTSLQGEIIIYSSIAFFMPLCQQLLFFLITYTPTLKFLFLPSSNVR